MVPMIQRSDHVQLHHVGHAGGVVLDVPDSVVRRAIGFERLREVPDSVVRRTIGAPTDVRFVQTHRSY